MPGTSPGMTVEGDGTSVAEQPMPERPYSLPPSIWRPISAMAF
ncbi:hypothetical protein ACVWVY_002490 [Bradyrhizobium sp. URHC0002]